MSSLPRHLIVCAWSVCGSSAFQRTFSDRQDLHHLQKLLPQEPYWRSSFFPFLGPNHAGSSLHTWGWLNSGSLVSAVQPGKPQQGSCHSSYTVNRFYSEKPDARLCHIHWPEGLTAAGRTQAASKSTSTSPGSSSSARASLRTPRKYTVDMETDHQLAMNHNLRPVLTPKNLLQMHYQRHGHTWMSQTIF